MNFFLLLLIYKRIFINENKNKTKNSIQSPKQCTKNLKKKLLYFLQRSSSIISIFNLKIK